MGLGDCYQASINPSFVTAFGDVVSIQNDADALAWVNNGAQISQTTANTLLTQLKGVYVADTGLNAFDTFQDNSGLLWHFEECDAFDNGDPDITGNGTLTLTDTTFTHGTGLIFNGSTSEADTGWSIPAGVNDLLVFAEVELDSKNSNEPIFSDREAASGWSLDYFFRSGGEIRCTWVNATPTNRTATGSVTTSSTGQTYIFVANANAGNCSIYHDITLASDIAADGTTTLSSQNMQNSSYNIKLASNTSAKLAGKYKSFGVISGVAFTETEIQNIVDALRING